jgi:hypothetical protein
VTRVTRTLEEFKTVTATTFDRRAKKWTVTATPEFDSEAVSSRIRAAGVEDARELGEENAPPWVARWTRK